MPHSEYTNKLATSLNDLRKENQLCDVVIHVSGRDFNVHKNVLAARSSYFLATFTSGFREKSESTVNIDGNPNVFEVILEYVYTGEMKINGGNAFELLEMAGYMQLLDASHNIIKFVQEHLEQTWGEAIHIGDVYKIYEMAKTQDHLHTLVKGAENYMCGNYQKMKSSSVFLQHAKGDFLMKFLECSDLSSRSEEKEVLELVVKWLKHDFENRRQFAPSLLRRIRLGLVSEESRTELLDAEILEIPECRQTLEEVTRLQDSNLSEYGLAQGHPQLFATRSTVTASIAVSVATYESTKKASFEYFDMKKQQWTEMSSMSCLHWVPSLIVIDEELYAVGGVRKTPDADMKCRYYRSFDDYFENGPDEDDISFKHSNTVDLKIYNAQQNSWKSLPGMGYGCKPRLVYENRCIYAIGDVDEESTGVECFDMAEKKWKKLASLPDKFSCTSAVGCQGGILLYGQYSTSIRGPYTSYKYTGEILVYYPRSDQWISKLSELNPSSSHPSYSESKPVLFVHQDQCYRVIFPKKERPIVHLLKFRSSRSNPLSSVRLDKEIQQDCIPPADQVCAFRIEEKVYIRVKYGVVLDTGLKIREDQSSDVDLSGWEHFNDLEVEAECSNTVTFTFDLKN